VRISRANSSTGLLNVAENNSASNKYKQVRRGKENTGKGEKEENKERIRREEEEEEEEERRIEESILCRSGLTCPIIDLICCSI
jgi:hypothetical protein